MPYQFRINGIDIRCETVQELEAAMKIKGFAAKLGHGGNRTWDEQDRGRQGAGPRRSWEEAEEYAAKHGCTRMEARSILAKIKKQQREQAAQATEAQLMEVLGKRRRGRPRKVAS